MPHWVGNGLCDHSCNNAVCGWDDGDCAGDDYEQLQWQSQPQQASVDLSARVPALEQVHCLNGLDLVPPGWAGTCAAFATSTFGGASGSGSSCLDSCRCQHGVLLHDEALCRREQHTQPKYAAATAVGASATASANRNKNAGSKQLEVGALFVKSAQQPSTDGTGGAGGTGGVGGGASMGVIVGATVGCVALLLVVVGLATRDRMRGGSKSTVLGGDASSRIGDFDFGGSFGGKSRIRWAGRAAGFLRRQASSSSAMVFDSSNGSFDRAEDCTSNNSECSSGANMALSGGIGIALPARAREIGGLVGGVVDGNTARRQCRHQQLDETSLGSIMPRNDNRNDSRDGNGSSPPIHHKLGADHGSAPPQPLDICAANIGIEAGFETSAMHTQAHDSSLVSLAVARTPTNAQGTRSSTAYV